MGPITRNIVDVAVLIPDASPVLTLARVGRIDLLGGFSVPIRIVDQVHYEICSDQEGAFDMAAQELRTMNDDLHGLSPFDVLEKLERGKIGHRAAMDWLEIESLNDLVEIIHVNGRLTPGHQPMRVSAATRALVRSIFRPLPDRSTVRQSDRD